jgi:uncharacterized membrane protein YcaP (DUF421 family)
MHWLVGVNWKSVFVPDTPLLEIFVRGTVVYLALFALLRFVRRRQSGAMSVSDLLVVVLIADASQNAMAGEYRAVPDGLLLVAVIVGWDMLLDWAAFRYPTFEWIVRPPKLQLVADGKPLWRNMAMEFVTQEELQSALREQGVDDLSKVKAAYMEPTGRISAITADGERHEPAPEPRGL